MHQITTYTKKLLQGRVSILPPLTLASTVQDGQKITKLFLGEHKVITAEQQFLGLILWFFMYLKWPWLLGLFAVLL